MNEESLLKLSPGFEKLMDILAVKKPLYPNGVQVRGSL